MSRRRRPEKREILPDPKFGDQVLSKFMNSVMLDGKKSVAESIVYGALENVETRLKREPIGVFHDALNNVKPGIEVRSRRVGGADPRRPRARPSRRALPCAARRARHTGCQGSQAEPLEVRRQASEVIRTSKPRIRSGHG